MPDIDLDACIEFLGPTNNSGYGSKWRKYPDGTVETMAHRAAWRDAYGPIPDGLTIDHLCRNRICVNVQHMELVTRIENSRRAGWTEASAQKRRAKTHCVHGHEYTSENTYRDKRGRRGCRTCRIAKSRAWWKANAS